MQKEQLAILGQTFHPASPAVISALLKIEQPIVCAILKDFKAQNIVKSIDKDRFQITTDAKKRYFSHVIDKDRNHNVDKSFKELFKQTTFEIEQDRWNQYSILEYLADKNVSVHISTISADLNIERKVIKSILYKLKSGYMVTNPIFSNKVKDAELFWRLTTTTEKCQVSANNEDNNNNNNKDIILLYQEIKIRESIMELLSERKSFSFTTLDIADSLKILPYKILPLLYKMEKDFLIDSKKFSDGRISIEYWNSLSEAQTLKRKHQQENKVENRVIILSYLKERVGFFESIETISKDTGLNEKLVLDILDKLKNEDKLIKSILGYGHYSTPCIYWVMPEIVDDENFEKENLVVLDFMKKNAGHFIRADFISEHLNIKSFIVETILHKLKSDSVLTSIIFDDSIYWSFPTECTKE